MAHAEATMLELDTPHGVARAHLHPGAGAQAALVVGHGAGGGFGARDLVRVSGVAQELGMTVALVEQPYRVAGRRSPAPARQLDAAWIAVVRQLADGPLGGLTLIAGGRSSGARVACRTAHDTDAAGVLCLAFPVHPPGKPEKTRQPELDAVAVPALVVQGESDPFGRPEPSPLHEVVFVRGTHSLRSDLDAVAAAARDWLARQL
jgi:uncharacterized protein